MIKEIGRKMDEENEKLDFWKRIKKYKEQPNWQGGYNNWNEKKTLEGINCRLNDTEELINKVEVEDRMVDITEAEQ